MVMKLSHLRDAVAVAEAGSLRAAARQLGITQPAMTRSIRELEHELGLSLFERHAKGVRPTEFGQAFVRRAAAAQSELRRARDELDQLRGRSTGEVSMGLSAAAVISLMPTALRAFRRRFPQAVLKVSESLFQPIEPELLDGSMDFWVGPLDVAYSSRQLSVERLFDNERVIVARKGHALASAKRPDELAEAQWIRPVLSNRSTEGDFVDLFAQFGLQRPEVVFHSRSALITLLAVINSDLLTVLPKQWLGMPGTAGLLDVLDVGETITAAPICMVRRLDVPLTPLAEHLSDLVRRASIRYDREAAGSAP